MEFFDAHKVINEQWFIVLMKAECFYSTLKQTVWVSGTVTQYVFVSVLEPTK
jgi:hypothetical protein